MNNTNAIEIFNSIVDGKDGTLDVMGYDLPTHGYFVGGAQPPLVFESVEAANTPGAMRAILSFVTDATARYVGWWTDSETGKVYLDATTWFYSHPAAVRACRGRGEIAYWDIANQQEIRP